MAKSCLVYRKAWAFTLRERKPLQDFEGRSDCSVEKRF